MERRGIDLSRMPLTEVRAALEQVLGRKPSDEEFDQHITSGTLTDRRCENPLCDWNLQLMQSRFCTRCWKAIEICREHDRKK